MCFTIFLRAFVRVHKTVCFFLTMATASCSRMVCLPGPLTCVQRGAAKAKRSQTEYTKGTGSVFPLPDNVNSSRVKSFVTGVKFV